MTTTDERIVWNAPLTETGRGFDLEFVLRQALIITLASLLGGVTTAWVLHRMDDLVGNPHLIGLIPVITLLVSFIVSTYSLRVGLAKIPLARLANALIAAGIVTVASGALLVVLGFIALASDPAESWIAASMFACMLASAGAVLGALMANAVIPEEGPVPHGTQHETLTPEQTL